VQEPYERVRAKSRIAQCCGRVNLRKGDILIALRAYLDSSGKLQDDWITLAAIAANDEMWAEFETVWAETLDGYIPKGQYIHMKEIFRLEKAFDKNLGWTHDRAFGLVNKCLVYMSHLDKLRFRMFYCSVNLVAWRKLRAETYQMPEPIDMCNRFCSEGILGWYLFNYPDMIDIEHDTIKYFFDRHEYFENPFKEQWNTEKDIAEATGQWSVWKLIDEVAPLEMKTTPGIQAADIIAWGRNRETFTKSGDVGSQLAHILRTVVPSYSVVWDEQKLREQFKPLIYL
jgi:hypothetical protein